MRRSGFYSFREEVILDEADLGGRIRVSSAKLIDCQIYYLRDCKWELLCLRILGLSFHFFIFFIIITFSVWIENELEVSILIGIQQKMDGRKDGMNQFEVPIDMEDCVLLGWKKKI